MARQDAYNAEIQAEILTTLGKILDSGVIGEKSRLQQLLRYLVVEELEGRGERLKAYAIATDVLGRGADFDPSTDSIVRVEMNRLRQVLNLYQLTGGKTDRVRISIPKGIYRPDFTEIAVPAEEAGATAPEQDPKPSAPKLRDWRRIAAIAGVAVLLLAAGAYFVAESFLGETAHLRSSSADKGLIRVEVTSRTETSSPSPTDALDRALAEGIARDLRGKLSRNDAFLVYRSEGSDGTHAEAVDFRVNVAVQTILDEHRVSLEVVNARTEWLVWGKSKNFSLGPQNKTEDLADELAQELGPRILVSYKEDLRSRDPSTLSAEQLFILATWVPGSEQNAFEWAKKRVELARLAIAEDPEYGPAYSLLADTLAYLSAIDPGSYNEAAMAEAEASWGKALELASFDANAVFNVALAQSHLGYTSEASRTMQRVKELDPSHALAQTMHLAYANSCTAPSDAALEVFIAHDNSLGKTNPLRWMTQFWLSAFHLYREEYALGLEAAERSAQIYQIPHSAMSHALLLHAVGRSEEAFAKVLQQQKSWPTFEPRHFAEVTMPRLCRESTDASGVLSLYSDFADAWDAR